MIAGCLFLAKLGRAEPSSVYPFTAEEVVVSASFPEPCAAPTGAADLPVGAFTSLLLPVLQMDPGLLWFNIDVLFATVTDEYLERVTAVALDATAFETWGRTRDFRVQKEVDRAIRKALEAGEEVPGDVMLGPDGKLVRCPSDPQARGSRRSASSETGHVQKWFDGYFLTSLAVSQDYKWSGDPTEVYLKEDLGPLTLAFSTAPATRDKGPIARDVTAALKQLLPQLRTVTADREFTEKRESFTKRLHDQDIAVIMDYPRPFTEKFDLVTLPNGELVYESCGDHFVLWMPKEFHGAPDSSLTEEEKRDWYERRAAYRYSSNGTLKDGKVQKLCPQCAGRMIYAEKTRMGKYRNAPHPDSALSFGPPFAAGYCCCGSVTLSGDNLGHWQPVPWGTGAHTKLYNAGRNRIENTYNLAKEDGAISKKACRTPGAVPRNMAFLATQVVNSVQFMEGESNTVSQPDDTMPQAALSLFCVEPAFTNGSDSSDSTDPISREEVAEVAAPSRAPP